MESLLREVPEEILHRPHQILSADEAQEQLDNVEALIGQLQATDNQSGRSADQFDLDPRPGHILLRNDHPENAEEAEAQFQDGLLECRFRRFAPSGGLIRLETLKARSGPDQVELLRTIWKVDAPERISYYHLDRRRPDASYLQSNED